MDLDLRRDGVTGATLVPPGLGRPELGFVRGRRVRIEVDAGPDDGTDACVRP